MVCNEKKIFKRFYVLVKKLNLLKKISKTITLKSKQNSCEKYILSSWSITFNVPIWLKSNLMNWYLLFVSWIDRNVFDQPKCNRLSFAYLSSLTSSNGTFCRTIFHCKKFEVLDKIQCCTLITKAEFYEDVKEDRQKKACYISVDRTHFYLSNWQIASINSLVS